MRLLAVKFLKGLVHHFGVPNRVATNNDMQFSSRTIMQHVQDLGGKDKNFGQATQVRKALD